MRKKDYFTLARYLRRQIKAPLNCDVFSEYWQTNGARLESEAQQAQQMARYLAEHLSINGEEFLALCGLRQ